MLSCKASNSTVSLNVPFWLSARCGGFVPLPAPLKDAALANVRRVNANQFRFGDTASRFHQPAWLAQLDAVDGITHTTRVGEVRLLDPQLQILTPAWESRRRRILGLHHQFGNGQQFLQAVIGKADVMGDARMEAGIVLEKGFHSLPIAGQDDHQSSRWFSITWSNISIASGP